MLEHHVGTLTMAEAWSSQWRTETTEEMGPNVDLSVKASQTLQSQCQAKRGSQKSLSQIQQRLAARRWLTSHLVMTLPATPISTHLFD